MPEARVHYELSLPDRVEHLVDVKIEISGLTGESAELVMPTWTPGSYLVREFARQVQRFRAEAGGQAVAWTKVTKNRWRVAATGGSVTVFYQVYGYELTVRTNHVDLSHAHIMPAGTLMYLDGVETAAIGVTVDPPEGWQVATGLRPIGGDQPWPGAGRASFTVPDWDELYDCPLEIGTHRTLQFEVDGKPHRIVIWGHGNEQDERLRADAQRIVETTRDFWGGLPYDTFTFILLLGDKTTRGGLEHRNSTSLALPRSIFQPARDYERYLTLVTHEFFHTWNVKRLRAAGLGPFDYTGETYTTLLWQMEGVTEYYTDVLLVRAGLLTAKRYLERLAEDIVTLQHIPGRHEQSLAMSSFDTWIKFYRPDEHSVNNSISYYLKGALVAMLLDLELRRQTGNQHSLDDVLRWLYREYPLSGPGLPPDGYQQAIKAITGLNLDDFFVRYVDSTDELPFESVLGAVGFDLNWSFKEHGNGGDESRPALGIRTKQEHGRLIVANVLSDGQAARSGIGAGDEIVAIDGARVLDESDLNARLAERQAGEQVELLCFRRGLVEPITLVLGQLEPDLLTIEPRKDATEADRILAASWLGQDPHAAAKIQ